MNRYKFLIQLLTFFFSVKVFKFAKKRENLFKLFFIFENNFFII